MDESTPAAPPPIPKTTPLAPKDHGRGGRDLPQRDRRRAHPARARPRRAARRLPRRSRKERFRPPGVDTHPAVLGHDARALVLRLPRRRASPRSGPRRAATAATPRSSPPSSGSSCSTSARSTARRRCRSSCGRSSPTAGSRRARSRRPRCAGSTSSTASTACPCARAAARRRGSAGRRRAPGALWHADVCHGPALTIDGKSRPLRIHALLDDASRFIVAIEARHTERETDMLEILVRALRRHGPPDVLYLDNGSTYIGEILRTACARLGISLLHARPYDAPARGKMERFWRTLREGCLDHLGSLTSLHDVEVRLCAFLDEHYHRAPHASLMGRAPGAVFAAREAPGRRPRRAEAARRAHRPRAPPRPRRHDRLGGRPGLGARPGLPRRPRRHRRPLAARRRAVGRARGPAPPAPPRRSQGQRPPQAAAAAAGRARRGDVVHAVRSRRRAPRPRHRPAPRRGGDR